jgi:hypothetical protein
MIAALVLLALWGTAICACWGFWILYSGGALRPTSWAAIATMPVWTVQSIWAGRKATRLHEPFAAMRRELQRTRSTVWQNRAARERVRAELEDLERLTPEGVPRHVRRDLRKTIQHLETAPHRDGGEKGGGVHEE